jgi:hypothetical protein
VFTFFLEMLIGEKKEGLGLVLRDSTGKQHVQILSIFIFIFKHVSTPTPFFYFVTVTHWFHYSSSAPGVPQHYDNRRHGIQESVRGGSGILRVLRGFE